MQTKRYRYGHALTHARLCRPAQISAEEKAAGHVPRTAPKSRYARPVTPGLIRKIIREEVVSAVKGATSHHADPRYADLEGGHPGLIGPDSGGHHTSLHATMQHVPSAGLVSSFDRKLEGSQAPVVRRRAPPLSPP